MFDGGTMNNFKKIIFVCETGTARAHMAAEIMRREYGKEDLQIVARGLVVLFPEPINEKAEAVMVSNGLNVAGLTAQPLLSEEIDGQTLVIVMNESQKAKVKEDFSRSQNVYTLTEVVGEPGEVLDPYGGPLTGYGKCFEEIEKLVRKLVYNINREDI